MTSATLIEKCCLIAESVAGNPTHFMVEQAFDQAKLDWRFMSFEVAPAQLGDAIRGLRALGFRGVKVAEPHQAPVLEYLDELTDRARLCGSVNCVTSDGARLLGDNTEGLAAVELLSEHADLAGVRAMVLGSGSAARAIAASLAQAGAAAISVASRSPESGRQLVATLRDNTPADANLIEYAEGDTLPVARDVTCLVNATSWNSANAGAPFALDFSSSAANGVALDVAYQTLESPLIEQAGARGWRTIDGVSLLVAQTALALKTWTGVAPNAEALRESAEEFLGL